MCPKDYVWNEVVRDTREGFRRGVSSSNGSAQFSSSKKVIYLSGIVNFMLRSKMEIVNSIPRAKVAFGLK